MHQPSVVTIIINWKLKEETRRCLEAIQHLNYPSRVIVIDNGSTDGSAEYLADLFPGLEMIALPVNIGFGAACNYAIRYLLSEENTEYFFLLNNDTLIDPPALNHLINATQDYPNVGILSPKIYYADSPHKLWYAGARRRRGVLAAANTGRGKIDHSQYEQIRKVDYVFGAAMLIHRSVFERIGLFDERFFLYLEDLDFCLRAQRAGFDLLYVPKAHIYHKVSASTEHYHSLRKYHHVRSSILFLQKNASPLLIVPVLAFWFGVMMKMLFLDLFQGNLNIIRPYWLGLVNGIRDARLIQDSEEENQTVKLSFSDNRLD